MSIKEIDNFIFVKTAFYATWWPTIKLTDRLLQRLTL